MLKHVNTVARKQRIREVTEIKRVLAACGPVEDTRMLSYHLLAHNIRAADHDACPHGVPDAFDVSTFFLSRVPFVCGCGHTEGDPLQANKE